MALNLSRNTRAFVSTNASDTGFTAANTWEIQIMAGYSLTQATSEQTITINEMGKTPIRGQRSFNQALNPAEFSFTTYMRPYMNAGAVTATERMLWNAISGNKQFVDPAAYKALDALDGAILAGSVATLTFTAAHNLAVGDAINLVGFSGADASWNTKATVNSVTSPTVVVVGFPENVPTTLDPDTTNAKVTTSQWTERSDKAFTDFYNSNAHQLAPLYLIFKIDTSWYRITGAAINQATINFAIDGIAMIEWQGMGFELLELGTTGQAEILANAVAPNTSAAFIVNKLSTVTLEKGIGGGGTSFLVPITGGSVTINNNLTFLTPDILGTVNKSIGYFTGTRAVSGNLTAYLRTGAGNNTAALLADVLASASADDENFYKVQVEIGGLSNATRVELLMNAVQLQVPTVSVEDVISTEIGFTAQGYTGAAYDIEKSNELVVSYYGV
jgi:hypothetical protein